MPVWKGIVGKAFKPQAFEQYVSTVKFGLWRPKFVVLHNTAIPRLSQWHSVPGRQRMLGLQRFYRDQQKWSAGPHLFVADDFIWVFTALNTTGVHSPSWNAISWGVEVVGDYATEQFTGSVVDNAVAALSTLHRLIGLDPETLRLHKEDPRTTHNCPGKNINKEAIIQRVMDHVVTLSVGEHSPAEIRLPAKTVSRKRARKAKRAATRRKSKRGKGNGRSRNQIR